MTLNEIAYNVLNLVRGGQSHHDESISLRQIKFNIQYYGKYQHLFKREQLHFQIVQFLLLELKQARHQIR